MTHDDLAELLADLTDDGDEVELPDGRTLRLTFKPDDVSVMDSMGPGTCYGSVQFVTRRRYEEFEHGPRPDGFDGNAEILRGRNFDDVWWQPPEDVKRGTEIFERVRANVVELLEYGYCGIVLELLDGADAYGRPIVAHVASLWGIEPFPERSYVAEVVRDLAEELGPDVLGYTRT